MKKLIALAVILLALFVIFGANKSDEAINNPPSTTSGINPDPSNGTFYIEDDAVTLSSGRLERQIPGSAFSEEIELSNIRAFGDLNKDGKNDVSVILIQSGGGSGVFVYVAAYVSGQVGYKGTNAIFIGDRISPESLDISSGTITFRYLDRGEDEPYAAEPTIERTRRFSISQGVLIER